MVIYGLDLDPDPVNIKTDPKLLIMWILNQRPYNEGRLFNCDIGLKKTRSDLSLKNQTHCSVYVKVDIPLFL